jgi:hypothetical protein
LYKDEQTFRLPYEILYALLARPICGQLFPGGDIMQPDVQSDDIAG